MFFFINFSQVWTRPYGSLLEGARFYMWSTLGNPIIGWCLSSIKKEVIGYNWMLNIILNINQSIIKKHLVTLVFLIWPSSPVVFTSFQASCEADDPKSSEARHPCDVVHFGFRGGADHVDQHLARRPMDWMETIEISKFPKSFHRIPLI